MGVTVFDEVVAATRQQPRLGETPAQFAWRAADKLDKLCNTKAELWGTLSDAAQDWHVKAMEQYNVAFNEKLKGDDLIATIPPLEGFVAAVEKPEEKPDKKPDPDAGGIGSHADEKEKPMSVSSARRKVVPPVKAGAKSPKSAKAKAKAAAANGARGRPGLFAVDAKIKVLVDANPKRKGSDSAKRFAKYKTGMTVSDALKAGVTWPDLRWDRDHKYISIG
jgi:hypothetical protein